MKASGVTIVVPDRGLFNFFTPRSDMDRVKFGDHPEFEKSFEVYSTISTEAQSLLTPSTREMLLKLKGAGKLFAYVSDGTALVAITGDKRFEPGRFLIISGARDQLRSMFEDVRTSLGVLGKLSSVFR